MNTQNAYEKLYNDMKSQFTVLSNENEYTLGGYMSMKANATATNLPTTSKSAVADSQKIAAVFSYVNDKLAVKKAPVKDKTIRTFPFRTSAASLLSAVVSCALIFSFGIFAARGATSATVEEIDEVSETEIYENDN